MLIRRPMAPSLRAGLAAALLIATIILWRACEPATDPTGAPEPPAAASGQRASLNQELLAHVARIEAREAAAKETIWARETLAQSCGKVFEAYWDAINAATNKLMTAAQLAFGKIVIPRYSTPHELAHGILRHQPSSENRSFSSPDWNRLLAESATEGWALDRVEFRHNRFEITPDGSPARSLVYFSAHLTQPARPARAVLEGDLTVQWRRDLDPGVAPPAIERIDASNVALKTRAEPPPFELVLRDSIAPPENAYSIDPLLVQDLDGDGIAEIILTGKNQVYRRTLDGTFESKSLCSHPLGLISSAVIADFDGDGSVDLLVQRHEGLLLFGGSASGQFEQPGRRSWPAPPELKYPMVLSAGDIDRDGDLDLFLGQYKVPYENGSLPTPFHDANDGYPAFVLRNDGQGRFEDITAAVGLTEKRWRRTYSGSFADLNGDGHLDLVVISDFAGADVYQNDGSGRLADRTASWIPNPRAFGMAHALSDFNSDGVLDLLMIGMTSPTADRLEHAGLRRAVQGHEPAQRAAMTRGNRLYLGRAGGGYAETALGDVIARAGWAWGCGAADFDNDGFVDAYIANGLESRATVRDYEPEYWLHDLFVGRSEEDSAAYLYFKTKFGRTRGAGQSYGGYEKNRLYLNQGGEQFLEAGHLFGVALENDSRNVVADDIDGDGRVDLIVTSFEVWPDPKQTLRIYLNRIAQTNHFIGFRFPPGAQIESPIGATVAIRYGDRAAIRTVTTGDSYRSQHSTTVHFGLGAVSQIDAAEIRWANEKVLKLPKPAINRYHTVVPP